MTSAPRLPRTPRRPNLTVEVERDAGDVVIAARDMDSGRGVSLRCSRAELRTLIALCSSADRDADERSFRTHLAGEIIQ
jgi:hypothetical protein